jgi:hypothetical protein
MSLQRSTAQDLTPYRQPTRIQLAAKECLKTPDVGQQRGQLLASYPFTRHGSQSSDGLSVVFMQVSGPVETGGEAPEPVEELEAPEPAEELLATDLEAASQPGDEAARQRDGESGKDRKSGRPLGISKIDLRTVWGSRTPAGLSEPQAGILLTQSAGRGSPISMKLFPKRLD